MKEVTISIFIDVFINDKYKRVLIHKRHVLVADFAEAEDASIDVRDEIKRDNPRAILFMESSIKVC